MCKYCSCWLNIIPTCFPLFLQFLGLYSSLKGAWKESQRGSRTSWNDKKVEDKENNDADFSFKLEELQNKNFNNLNQLGSSPSY